MTGAGLSVLPVAGLPEVSEGMAIGELVAANAELEEGDVVVISQKVVSKAEGRVRSLSSAIPGAEARKLAAVLGKDPALVEIVLEESREVIRAEGSVLIVETRQGFVCANAGVDTSNLPDPHTVCLLPEDPDASARRIRSEITRRSTGDGGGTRRTKRSVRRVPPSSPDHRGGDQRQFRQGLAARARQRSRSGAPGSSRSTTGGGGPTPAGASSRRP